MHENFDLNAYAAGGLGVPHSCSELVASAGTVYYSYIDTLAIIDVLSIRGGLTPVSQYFASIRIEGAQVTKLCHSLLCANLFY